MLQCKSPPQLELGHVHRGLQHTSRSSGTWSATVGIVAQLQGISWVGRMKEWKIFRNKAFFFFMKLFLLMGEVRDGTKALFFCFILEV